MFNSLRKAVLWIFAVAAAAYLIGAAVIAVQTYGVKVNQRYQQIEQLTAAKAKAKKVKYSDSGIELAAFKRKTKPKMA